MENEINNSFSTYNSGKIKKLLTERYHYYYFPTGFVQMIKTIEKDIKNGKCSSTGKTIEKANIFVSNDEIIKFASLMKGEFFSKQVERILNNK